MGKLLRSALMACAIAWALPSAAQDAVFIIRHAQKADDSNDPPLTELGREQAAGWARMLEEAGLDAIYTSDAKRTRETGGIISNALGVPRHEVVKDDVAGLVQHLADEHPDGVVLVVSHAETIPSVILELGVFDLVHVDNADFTSLFLITGLGAQDPRVLHLKLP